MEEIGFECFVEGEIQSPECGDGEERHAQTAEASSQSIVGYDFSECSKDV